MFIGILPTVILSMVGEELFMVVFGERWVDAGRYTQILAPWVFFTFIASPLSTIFLVYERQGAALFVNLIIFILHLSFQFLLFQKLIFLFLLLIIYLFFKFLNFIILKFV